MGTRPWPPGDDDGQQPRGQHRESLLRLASEVAVVVANTATTLVTIYIAIKGGGSAC